MQIDINKIKSIIKNADAILITAGAGIGVDSGLSDYNSIEDFWRAYPALKKENFSYSEIVSHKWFVSKPSFVWAFYGQRLNLYRKTVPHQGFKLLLDLVKAKNDNYFIYTSNVDGQFQKAGFDENKILEIHGTIHYLQCVADCHDSVWSSDDENVIINKDTFEAINVPKCPSCGSVARPNIFMFADWHWDDSRTYFQEQKFNTWFENIQITSQKMVIIEIGAGTTIPTVRKKGNLISNSYKNATLIRINTDEYQVNNEYSYSVPLTGLCGLEKLLF